jgi:hypothetical protein
LPTVFVIGSSRTFQTEGLWDKVRENLLHTFGWYMRKYIAESGAKGVIAPVGIGECSAVRRH